MATSSSASASASASAKYDVFISFRGDDVRSGFLSHLEKELRRKGIDVYVDEMLKRGEEISSSLMRAIEESMIALVIFSKDYASSRWCLEELVKIMECKEAPHQKQIVIPVFYFVDPSDVSDQKGTYEEAFNLHKDKFNDKEVETWRSVLQKSANLAGHDSSTFKNDSELLEAIVQDISKKVEDNRSIVSESELIGFHENFTSVKSLMEIKSQEVRKVGIWGMGGIGKTTLARAIFDEFLPEFESHCFLENVRVNSAQPNGLSSLRQKLVSELLDQKDNINLNDAKRRLQRKRVLIVLDDVNDSKQLKELTGCVHWLRGSRIIVTSRERQVLRSGGILHKHIHEVIPLNREKSLELFSKHAFHQNHPNMGYEELSEMTVAIAQGIPLALEILGSHFYDRDKANWKSELNKLKKHPHKQIHDVLRISYDGLSAMDKEIFLLIAFFYTEQREEKIIGSLEECGFEAVSGIQNLMNKALIKRDWLGCITMHDLIQEMADQIIGNTCDPERDSRLKDSDQICKILEISKGIDEIEGIVLPGGRRYPPLRADFFIKMKNLRILKILDQVEVPLDLQPFSNKIRCLHWEYYPLESLPSGSLFENLVELHMEQGNFKRLWDGKQDLANLKKIDLSQSEQLMELPDLSSAQRLEIVNLHACKSLRSVHPSLLSLHSIVRIDVSFCEKLESLESNTHLESLTGLHVLGCNSLKIFCLSSKKLRSIDLFSCGVEKLHLQIGRFTELRLLVIDGARLGSLPISELCGLTNLEVFGLYNFKQVICTMEISSLFLAWPKLTSLELNGSAVETLPACVNQLSSLTVIYLQRCERLKSIHGLPPSIQRLGLDGSAVETLPAYVKQLSSLTRISLSGCKRLKSILELPPFIQNLDADDCISLETVSSTSQLKDQCQFSFKNCVMLDESSIHFIEKLTRSSVTLPRHDEDAEDDEAHDVASYPGSRVPNWMDYKQMTYASNVIEFTCTLVPSPTIVLCCVAPHDLIPKESVVGPVYCNISCYDHLILISEYSIARAKLNSDHVFVWYAEGRSLLYNGSGEFNVKCEFLVSYYCEDSKEDSDEEEEIDDSKKEVVPAKTCGVHLIYDSESEYELESESESELESESESELESESESSWKRRKVADDDGIISNND